jgi:pimeloyl-ACP methyl ester carboxylesterase
MQEVAMRLLSRAILIPAVLASGIAAAQPIPPFYTASRQAIAAGRPGTIIRQESLAAATLPPDAAAYRILYRSTGLRGERIAVSAVLALPAGAPPAGGRPIVAWQHPTSGIDDHCAPSLSPDVLRMIQGLPEMLQRGYAVVATDYPGLGTAGPHPYLVGLSSGRAVLDAVRAVRSLREARAGERFALWGHSQGGHATLSAGVLAHQYAPELRLVAVAAAAPAIDFNTLFGTGTADARLLSAMLMWSWSQVFGAPLDRLVRPAEHGAVELLARQCSGPPLDADAQPEAPPLADASYQLVRPLASTEPWRTLAARNTPGPLPTGIPAFLAQGAADVSIPPEVTARYMRRLCVAGVAVRMLVMPGVDHRFIARDAAGAAIKWMSDRFARRRPAPNDC